MATEGREDRQLKQERGGGIVPVVHNWQDEQLPRGAPNVIPSRREQTSTSLSSNKPSVNFESFANHSDAKPPQTVVKGTGQALGVANLNLIFWGQEWQNTSPPPPVSPNLAQIAIQNICSGPYLEGAGGGGSVSVKDVIHTTTPAPPATFDKPTLHSVPENFLTQLLNAGTLRSPSADNVSSTDFPEHDAPPNEFYVILMPTTTVYLPADLSGFHAFFDWTNPATNGTERIYYAWVLNNSTLNFITAVFSHELVEAFTDPDGTFIQMAPSSSNQWNEVADICGSLAFLDGVLVQSYWCAAQNACAIPYYSTDEPRPVIPAKLALQVIAIRLAYSRERHSTWIQKIRTKDPGSGDIFEIFNVDAIALIENGTNTFFVVGSDGSRSDVILGTIGNHSFLTTEPDDSRADNLLSLPKF